MAGMNVLSSDVIIIYKYKSFTDSELVTMSSGITIERVHNNTITGIINHSLNT